MSTLLDDIRKQLRPAQLQLKEVDKRIATLQEKIGSKAVVMAGGSYAKGTFIKGSHDIDIFIRFPLGTSDAAMSAAIKKAVPKAKTLHGSRDYFQVTLSTFDFELVPVLNVKDWREAKNAMDMSPLHVGYIAAHLTEKQKDDARLAKQFCKAIGVYGAESFIKGFSGYVLELLISIYGSFEALLKASASWTQGTLLDPAKHYKTPREALHRLNEAKTLSPLILIDPVQPDRNAAAALSMDAFTTFKAKAAAFRTAPHKKYFDLNISKARIKEEWKTKKVVFVTAKTPKGKRDIVGCKVLAKHETAIRLFKENEFPLVHAEWRFGEDKSLCWYVLDATTLPKQREQRGPPSAMTQAVQAFKREHASVYEKNSRLYAHVPRKYTSAQQVLKASWKGIKTS